MQIKVLFISFFMMATTMLGYSQINAVTDIGKEVLLFDDGTWQYVSSDFQQDKEIPINPTYYEKNRKSTFLLKSERNNNGFWLNPKKWTFVKEKDDSDAEYLLTLKGGDLYGMIISEKIEIPLETLKGIALENGRDAAPDIKIVKEEYRKVNDLDVLLLQMNGTLQGIKFSYYGYYYSDEGGTVQFVTYTSQSLLEDYIEECEMLLNGLVRIK